MIICLFVFSSLYVKLILCSYTRAEVSPQVYLDSDSTAEPAINPVISSKILAFYLHIKDARDIPGLLNV